eukprot:6926014-Pyramimonas_sp.AAC.1
MGMNDIGLFGRRGAGARWGAPARFLQSRGAQEQSSRGLGSGVGGLLGGRGASESVKAWTQKERKGPGLLL